MARPVPPQKFPVFAPPGVTLYSGLSRARPGQRIHLPQAHVADLTGKGKAETEPMREAREKDEAAKAELAAAEKAEAATRAAAAPASADAPAQQ